MSAASETSAGVVYGKALAEAAEAKGGLEALREVGEALAALESAWATDRVLRAFFLSSQIGAAPKRAALDRLATKLPKLLADFVRILLRRGRLFLLPQVASSYARHLDARLGRVPVVLSTAAPMPAARVARWAADLGAALKKEPVVRHVVKPDIVAGAVVRIGDMVADGSARRRLAELKREIIERGTHAIQS
jgi:F-type H+-transporting ATPase subunit delta